MGQITKYLFIIFLSFSCKEYKTLPTTVNLAGSNGASVSAYSALVTISSALDNAAGNSNMVASSGVIREKGLSPKIGDTSVCKSTGSPVVEGSDGDYAVRLAYCNFRQPSNGPDTIQGALERVKSFLCALQDVTKLDGVTRTTSVTVDTTCFTESFSQMVSEEGMNPLNLTVTSWKGVDSSFGNTDYENSILVVSNNEGLDLRYRIAYTANSSQLYGAILDCNNGNCSADTGHDFFAIAMDIGSLGATKLRYEGRFEGNDLHVRAIVTGTYNTQTSTFTSVDSVDFIQFLHWNSKQNARFITAKGGRENGYYGIYHSLVSSSPIYLASSYGASGACINGSCSGNSGIQLQTDADLVFGSIIDSTNANYVSAKSIFFSQGPILWDSITTSGRGP